MAAVPGQPSVAEDTGAFLATLLGHGLVEETGPPALPYFRPPHVGWVDDGDGVLLTDLRTGSAVPLSATASAIWRLLPQVESLEEMATGLSAEFVDMPADVSASLEALLRQLVQKELLETA